MYQDILEGGDKSQVLLKVSCLIMCGPSGGALLCGPACGENTAFLLIDLSIQWLRGLGTTRSFVSIIMPRKRDVATSDEGKLKIEVSEFVVSLTEFYWFV